MTRVPTPEKPDQTPIVQHWTAVNDTQWSYQYDASSMQNYIQRFEAHIVFEPVPGDPDKCFLKYMVEAHPKEGTDNYVKARNFMKMGMKAIAMIESEGMAKLANKYLKEKPAE